MTDDAMRFERKILASIRTDSDDKCYELTNADEKKKKKHCVISVKVLNIYWTLASKRKYLVDKLKSVLCRIIE